MQLLSSTEGGQQLFEDLQQQIKDWMQRYHELEASIQEGLREEPDNTFFKYAEEALHKGDFEGAAKLYQQSAKEREAHIEKIDDRIEDLQTKREQSIDLAARDRFNAGQAYELNFQPVLALQEYAKAYEHRPDNSEYAFQYALLSQKQNERQQAEVVYGKLIAKLREIKQPDEAQLSRLAMLLNNQAALIMSDTQRRGEAEKLYQEALSIRRELAQANPQVYLPDVAMTLNNLALLLAADTQRRGGAERLYQEAISIRRELAQANPQVYLPYVATTLNNLALLLAADTQHQGEAETLYQEALLIRRELVQSNPQVYLIDLVDTLGAFGMAYLGWEQPNKAKPLLLEAAKTLSPFAQQLPTVFGDKQALFLILAVQSDPENITFICTAMHEAAEVAQDADYKALATEISTAYQAEPSE